MSVFLTFFQDHNIEEKMQNAPDKAYEIGLFIGSMLPFIILVLLAYVIYRYNKNRNDKL